MEDVPMAIFVLWLSEMECSLPR